MTVAELKKKIENLPDGMEIFVDERTTDFRYGLVGTASVKEVRFYEDEDPRANDEWAEDTVLVLSEE